MLGQVDQRRLELAVGTRGSDGRLFRGVDGKRAQFHVRVFLYPLFPLV